MNYRYIAIEGCIGSGKTTLAKMMAADYGAKLILEQFENNPFLPRFYENPARYAFPLELFFMAERYRQMKEHVITPDIFHPFIISDYVFTKSWIFAHITLQKDELALFKRLFYIMQEQVPSPDLIVYLHNTIPNLLYNISIRGREYEQAIQPTYLEQLQEAYLNYFRQQTQATVLVVNTTQIDFVGRKDDYQKLKGLLQRHYEKGVHFLLGNEA